MAEVKPEMQEMTYRQRFPWLELFHTFRIALDVKKLCLGAGGVIMMYVGYLAFSQLMGFETSSGSNPFMALNTLEDAGLHGDTWIADWPPGIVSDPLEPGRKVILPFAKLFSLEQENSWTNRTSLFATLLTATWMLLVWGFFGGAITRLAAVQVARDEKLGLKEAVAFARNKYFSYIAAPVFPLVFVAVFLLCCFLGGLLVHIPILGPIFGGLLWGLPLLAGFLMAIILLGLAVGWPLMLPTISAEGSDSFDALSRSYSYVFQRPWHFLFYVALMVVYGVAVITFVSAFTYAIVYLSGWAVSAGAGRELTAAFFQSAPPASGWRSIGELLADPSVPVKGNFFSDIWLHGLYFLLLGFTYSYFWTAATTIYFLLRRDVDATDLDEVYLEEEDHDDFGAPPLGPEETDPALQPAAQATAHAQQSGVLTHEGKVLASPGEPAAEKGASAT